MIERPSPANKRIVAVAVASAGFKRDAAPDGVLGAGVPMRMLPTYQPGDRFEQILVRVLDQWPPADARLSNSPAVGYAQAWA
jgi:hypothetical protein